MNAISNMNNVQQSLQVSVIGDVEAGVFKLAQPSLIKNITEDNVTIEVKMAGMKEPIFTVFYPGWNVELVTEVHDAALGSLQYGN